MFLCINDNIQFIKNSKDLTSLEIKELWKNSLAGDLRSQETLKAFYMKSLNRIRPLYSNLSEEKFYKISEMSVLKALERGIKFKVENFEKYMSIASQTYFKYNLLPPDKNDSINLPIQLIKSFSKIEEIFNCLPIIEEQDEQIQIHLISLGFEYPIFSTRLLYYSYKKWTNKALRQIDIDLCVALLPPPQRVEWEVFYEKNISEVKATILNQLNLH